MQRGRLTNLSAGGLQNTVVMATNAMKRLPQWPLKVMATTVASGRKTFESVVGQRI